MGSKRPEKQTDYVMSALNRISSRGTMSVLLFVLMVEAMVVVSLRWLGWYGTGNAFVFVGCLIVTALPLVAALAVLIRRRLKFSLRSLLAATMFVALFLVLSMMPLVRHRSERQTSMRLLAVNATVNEGKEWGDFYSQFELNPPPKLVASRAFAVPSWLAAFTRATEAIPPDDTVRSIWLNSDQQCQVLAANWERLPSLQSVSVTRGVSTEGFQLLQDVLPRFRHLHCVHTHDVAVPPNWYKALTNIRTLWVWGEGAFRGKPFDEEHLGDITRLSNLEMLMVLGYAFDDQDARELATSTSIKRVILRGTAVTANGESDLANANRIVYRN